MRNLAKPEDQRIITALEYIHANYNRKLTLKEITNYVRLSRPQFCRVFKESMDMTAFRYINNLRLEKTEELVRNNEDQLKNVAYKVGLTPSYFSRLFKRTYGISPRQYRREFWNHRTDIVL